MNFTSLSFLFLFLPLVLALTHALPVRAVPLVLALASFLFYGLAESFLFLWPMLFTVGMDYILGRWMVSRPDKKKALLLVSLGASLGLLGFFKYGKLLAGTLTPWLGNSAENFFAAVVLPAGISFYTFQSISYVVDIYRGKAGPEKNFWRFASFVSFFPHLVAGPITRHDQLIPQLRALQERGVISRWAPGLGLLVLGLVKKVLIADCLASYINPWLSSPPELCLFTAWASLLGFTFQIYFDFSGYTDMAIGLGRLFGVELPVNFDRPYRSSNLTEFWSRWHITLSHFLRDYIYVPLGGNRLGASRRSLNLAITFFLGGMWHGASWTFGLWGLYHGLLLAAEKSRWPFLRSRALTFGLVAYGWVLFRSEGVAELTCWTIALLGGQGVGSISFVPLEFWAGLIILSIVLFKEPDVSRSPWLQNPGPWVQAALAAGFALAVLCFERTSDFLYFRF